MVGVVESNNMKKYDFSSLTQLEQLHDETVNNIVVNNNELNLYIDELHFEYGNQYSKCKIIFSDFEEIYSDVTFTFFKLYNDKIKSGKKFYLDEFVSHINKHKFSFEISDIYVGYERFLIVGRVSNCKVKYGNIIQVSIDAKSVIYDFY